MTDLRPNFTLGELTARERHLADQWPHGTKVAFAYLRKWVGRRTGETGRALDILATLVADELRNRWVAS